MRKNASEPTKWDAISSVRRQIQLNEDILNNAVMFRCIRQVKKEAAYHFTVVDRRIRRLSRRWFGLGARVLRLHPSIAFGKEIGGWLEDSKRSLAEGPCK